MFGGHYHIGVALILVSLVTHHHGLLHGLNNHPPWVA